MSLPREWSIQDSRGSMHRVSRPTSTLASTTAEHEAAYLRTQTLLDMDTSNADCLLVNDCKATGSLYSVHSAPLVPLTDLGIIKNKNGLGYDLGMDSPRRPASLAIDPQYLSVVAPQAAVTGVCRSLHQNQNSELDDEDNENLLTVSSLTARPLIAKSRELRSNKLAERKKNMVQSSAGPPDGGYGWFVVFGAFFVQFWVAGLVKSYGVLFVEIMETFPSSTAAVASWIPAILSALCLALAPLSSALCQRFSCRTVVFIGGLFCACGLTLSYFATSLYHLLFTFGILTGIGGGLSTTPGIVIVSRYFDKHRALANGICVSGTAAGSFIFPMLIEHLVYNFGFHGTILILGGCMFHVCLSATLYRPLELSPDPSATNTQDGAKSTISNGPMTNTTYLVSTDEPPNSKRFIEHLFLEESKNRVNDMYTNGFGKLHFNGSEKILDTDDEDKDTIGETTFMKPMKSIRSSSFLHSVEDLSTDSTCVYKNRSGYDFNRVSRRRNKNAFSTDEILCKFPPLGNEQLTIPATTNRGLSKSMIIPTPVSDFLDIDEEVCAVRKKTFCQRIQQYLDLTLVHDTTFILMTLSVTLMSTGCPYMLYYLPAFVISTNYTKSEAGYLVAISAALDLIGRLGFGYVSDLQLFDRKKAYNVCILGAGIAVLIIPLAQSWYLLCFASGLYGFCLGSWYLLIPVLLADLFGTERISSSYGLVRMFQSIGAISVPPLAGYLTDLFGGYEIIFYCMGSCMVLGSIPMLVSVVCSDPEDTANDSEISAVS